MSIHQSSVYVGSAAGGAISGIVGQHFGDWRISFVLFGTLGILLAVALWTLLKEAPRGLSDHTIACVDRRLGLPTRVARVLSRGSVLLLIAAFVGANFVAVLFLSWMPSFLYRRFGLGLAMSGINGTLYLSIASCLGTLLGGWLADLLTKRAIRRTGEPRSARMLTQSFGLLAGAPFLFLAGYGSQLTAVILAMTVFGLCKGVYDSNIWAALYDVVPIEQRGTAVGVMNSLGWLGGGVAPVAIAMAAPRVGMGFCISATAGIYFGFGLLLYGSARRRRLVPAPV
jgi:sugar phosphate permease